MTPLVESEAIHTEEGTLPSRPTSAAAEKSSRAEETLVGDTPPRAIDSPQPESEPILAGMDAVRWEELEPQGFYPRWGRPALNLTFAVLITPVTCVIGLLVGCVNLAIFRDPRKILFIQLRFGHRGKAFRMYKFRTMRDASIGAHESWKRGEDRSRVTRFGRLLRNTHLDELPQLINIFRGEMNVIGPRPEMIEIEVWASEHVPGFSRRLALKPGITGPAQITQGYTGCDVAGYSLKAAINESYRRELSLWTDLLIAVRTGIWMVRGRGWKWNAPSQTAQAPVVSAEESGSSSTR
jgi:lipopolysaccharide/colanic/teichoic acid biosynthesis glycosyltransferase